MPSYMDLMLQELQRQRNERAYQHGELLTAITALIQATQRLEQALAQPQSVAQAAAPAPALAQGVAQVQPQAGAQGEAQTPPPAENLHWLRGVLRWVASAFARRKNAC
jgi:hypothetical protein